jgi:AcrR family transcriptional regulator
VATALAAGGVNAVRVEALAKSLGVTKGGFYGYFGDRKALLTAMLDAREQESIDDVLGRRMQLLREGISTVCSDPDEVEVRSLLAFCMAIGSNFLAADHPGRSREEVKVHASALLLSGSPGEQAR